MEVLASMYSWDVVAVVVLVLWKVQGVEALVGVRVVVLSRFGMSSNDVEMLVLSGVLVFTCRSVMECALLSLIMLLLLMQVLAATAAATSYRWAGVVVVD